MNIGSGGAKAGIVNNVKESIMSTNKTFKSLSTNVLFAVSAQYYSFDIFNYL